MLRRPRRAHLPDFPDLLYSAPNENITIEGFGRDPHEIARLVRLDQKYYRDWWYWNSSTICAYTSLVQQACDPDDPQFIAWHANVQEFMDDWQRVAAYAAWIDAWERWEYLE